jgi:demethylmenaquinone methyltransferase/2-methoxy-6-polyprenyl-1,4-benzoquinol methylase
MLNGFEEMTQGGNQIVSGILPIPRTREEARKFYDRISRFYDCLMGTFERKYVEIALERLSIEKGETVLEIGFGSGRCLGRIAQSVGQKGRTYGIDISRGMLEVTKRRLKKAHLIDRVELCCGDATSLPYDDNSFDAVFMSFTLELFDSPDILEVLEEVKRVLGPGGRVGVVSMSKEQGESIPLRIYEWFHTKWPKYIDCRPIYVELFLQDAGYRIRKKEKVRLFGLPGEIVIAGGENSG